MNRGKCACRAAGDLGAIHPAWAGWNIIRDELVSPENATFTPGDVRASGYLSALVDAQRRQMREADAAEHEARESRAQRPRREHKTRPRGRPVSARRP